MAVLPCIQSKQSPPSRPLPAYTHGPQPPSAGTPIVPKISVGIRKSTTIPTLHGEGYETTTIESHTIILSHQTIDELQCEAPQSFSTTLTSRNEVIPLKDMSKKHQRSAFFTLMMLAATALFSGAGANELPPDGRGHSDGLVARNDSAGSDYEPGFANSGIRLGLPLLEINGPKGCLVSVGNCTNGTCALNLGGECTGHCMLNAAAACYSNSCQINVVAYCEGDCRINAVSPCMQEDRCLVYLLRQCLEIVSLNYGVHAIQVMDWQDPSEQAQRAIPILGIREAHSSDLLISVVGTDSVSTNCILWARYICVVGTERPGYNVKCEFYLGIGSNIELYALCH